MEAKRVITLVVSVFGLVLLIFGVSNCSETVGADEIVIRQGLFDGKLTIWNQPGWYMQNWGRLTRYKKSEHYWFSASAKEGAPDDDAIEILFNDGGKAKISGSLRFDLPLDEEHMRLIHMKYGSMLAIEKELIRPMVNKAVLFSGPLLSSKESYAEKRSYMINYIEDQLIHGVYRTEMEDKQVIDPLSGHEKTVTTVKLIADSKAAGSLARQETSLVQDFGLRVYGLSLTKIDYDPVVEAQITQQQKAVMEVQTAIAHAKQAEQKALTIAKEGEANAAKAKWDQETLKAKAVTEAQQEKEVATTGAQKERDVAKLQKEAAEFTKQKEILLGEGEGQRKKLAMQANGALEEKLTAWVEVNKAYASEFGKQQLVPTISMGGGGGGVGAAQFLDMMMVKTAHDLSLDFAPKRQSK